MAHLRGLFILFGGKLVLTNKWAQNLGAAPKFGQNFNGQQRVVLGELCGRLLMRNGGA